MDTAKEADRQVIETERRKRIEDEIAKAETEAKSLERLRKARELRVPPEPDSTHPRVVLSVRHLYLGVIKRAFVPTDTVSAVYDWVGSLSATPRHFALSKLPMVQIYPDESVTVASNELLTMIEVDDAIPLARDDNEVAFYSGESDSPTQKIISPFSEPFPIASGDKPPSILLVDDEETSVQENTSGSSIPPDVTLLEDDAVKTGEEVTSCILAILEGRRKAHAEAAELLPQKFVTISRHNVLK